MGTSQLELIELMRALDAEAPLAERNLWLIRLLAWVRGDSDDVDMAVARMRMLIDAAEVRPDWLHQWQDWWREFLTTMDATALLADLGFAPRGSFPSELVHRLRRKLLPATPETTDLSELFGLMFPTELDAKWLRALDEPTLQRLRTTLFRAEGHSTQAGGGYALRTLLDAMAYATGQISAIGQSADVRLRMSPEAREQRPFLDLPIVFETLRQAVLTHGRQSAPALVAAAELRSQLDACRAAAATVYAHLGEHGISVHIEFQLRQLRQRILRVKALLLCLDTDAPAQATAQLLSHLVRVNRDSLSMRALLASSTELLAAKVTERNAETGEHYITRTPRDYLRMLGAASGGGVVLAFTTWIKLGLGMLGLSAFWGGLYAGLNYAVSFVIIMLAHWTVATKQPAMTAPAMAARLKNVTTPEAVENFVDEMVYLLRSQYAAILGNVGLVIPAAIGIGVVVQWLGWDGVLSASHAREILAHHHLLGPTALFAAATGGLLFLSSIVAGWVENWFVFHRLDSVMAYDPRMTRWLGAARAARWGAYWRDHISGYTANISLGLMLGLVPPIIGFFGVPFEVRHVTLVAGQIAASAHKLGAQVLHQPAFGWAVAGIVITGLMNLTFSFTLAFRLALTAQNVPAVDRRRVYIALAWRALRRPWSFVLPLRVRRPASADAADAPPAAEKVTKMDTSA